MKNSKRFIEKAVPEKRAIRAIGLINAIISNRKIDDYQKLERIEDVAKAYGQVTGRYDIWMMPSMV